MIRAPETPTPRAALFLTVLAMATATVAQNIYQKELVTNGGAEFTTTDGWSTHEISMRVTRSSSELFGKREEYYFRGPEGTVSAPAPADAAMFQSIALGEAGGDIDAGHVAVGFSALMGGLGMADCSVKVTLTFMDALNTKLDNAEVVMDTADRMSKDLLALRTIKVCDVPTKTRQVILTVTFQYTPGAPYSSDAAIDGMSLRLLKRTPPPFVLLDNLVPAHSAETPAVACIWDSSELGIASDVHGADGFYVFAANSTSKVTAHLWIDVSADSAEIDAERRHASLSALVGGRGAASGQVSLSFYDEEKNSIDVHNVLTTDVVKPADRNYLTAVLQRDQGGEVPALTRWLRLDLVFDNAGFPRAAAVDDVVVRVRARDTMPPTGPTEPPTSPMFRRELLINGDADEVPTDGWFDWDVVQSNASLPGKQGDMFFVGTADSAELSQEVELTEISDEISQGNVGVGLSVWSGGMKAGSSATVYLTVYDKLYATLLEREMTSTAVGSLAYGHLKICGMPISSAYVEVFILFTEEFESHTAAVDGLSLRLVHNVPVKFQVDINLIPAPSAESPAAACLWANANVSVTPAYYGGDGSHQYSASVPGVTVGTRKIDISTDVVAIDHDSRLAFLSAFVGGDGPGDVTGRVIVTFLDKDEAEIGHIKTTDVTAAERGGKSELLKRSTLAEIPAHARFASVDLAFVGEGASVDLIDFRIQRKASTLAPSGPTEPPTSSIFRRDLLINGGAEEEMGPEWLTSDDEMSVIRSEEAVPGKHGSYFFRGPRGTADEPALELIDFYQEVAIDEASTEIDNGEVGIGIGMMAGATGKDEAEVAVELLLYDHEMEAMDATDSFSMSTAKAALEFRSIALCNVPPKTRFAEVYILLDYWWGDSNIASVDAITMGLVHKAPITYRESVNMIQAPGAESTAISCLWDGPVTATAAYPGGQGGLQFASSSSSGITHATQWVDFSSASGHVDRTLRTAVVAAFVGGAGSEDDSGELTVTFCDADKNPIGSLSTGKVTAEDRGGVAKLLPLSRRAQIPAESRWMKVTLAFDNAAAPGAALDSLDVRIEHNIPTLAPPTGPTEAPLSPMYSRNLIRNGDAESDDMSAWLYYDESDPKLNRTSMALPGKQGSWFFTGPIGSDEQHFDTLTVYQEFDVSELATDISNGHVAAGISALYGAIRETDADIAFDITFVDEEYQMQDDSIWVEQTVYEAGWSGLMTETLCSVPIATHVISVDMYIDSYEGNSVVAAVDAIVFRLVHKAPVPFRNSVNLVPLPSAESPAATCLWDSYDLKVDLAYEGGSGLLQFKSSASGTTTATLWIDVSADSGHIDRDQRLFGLSAAVGGSGATANSGEVTVAFCDKDKNPIPEAPPATTGKVTPADRSDEAMLMVQGVEAAVPKNTRMVKLNLVFDNAAGGSGAAIDDVNFFVRPLVGTLKPHPGPTPAPVSAIYGRQLVINGDANEEIGDEWSTLDDKMHVIRSNADLDGKNGEFFFRGPKSENGEEAQDFVDFFQTVDIGEASRDIDTGDVALGFSAMAGGTSDFDLEIGIDVTITTQNGDTLEFFELYFNQEKHAYLAPLEDNMCKLPESARRVEVYISFDYYAGLSNDAAVDDISLRLLKKGALPYSVDTNLVPMPSAESPVASCMWDSTVLETVAAYPGGAGVFQYGVSANGKTSIAMEVDVAPEAREIDSGKRFAVISALTGGAAGGDCVLVALTFLDDAKKPVGDSPALITDAVTAEDRSNLPMLIQRGGHMVVPKGTRAVKYELIFNNSLTTHGAGVDSLDFRLRHEPGTLPPTKRPTRPPTLEIYGRELVVNGGAEEKVGAPWQVWYGDIEVVRTVVPLEGKDGDYFFRGPLGRSHEKKASSEVEMEQPIDISEAGGDIDRGHVAAGMSAMVGCISGDECGVTLYLTFYDTNYQSLGEEEMSVTAAERGFKGKLVSKGVKECKLPKSTRVVEVYVSFEHEELLVNNDAATDAISVHLLKTTNMWFEEEINLLPAPSAETPAALCLWDESKIKIAPAYAGADGRFQYQGVSNGDAVVTKWIDLAPAAKEIDAGNRFGVATALAGGRKSGVSDSGVLAVTFCDHEKNPVGASPAMKTEKVLAFQRNYAAKLIPVSAGLKIPEKTRWAKVDMIIDNSDWSLDGAIDDVEFSVRSAFVPPVPTDKPTESVYVRNIVKNPEANLEPNDGWFGSGGDATEAIRSTANIVGKSGMYFFRGPKGATGAPAGWSAPMVQTIDVSTIADSIDAGTVAVGLSAMVGRVGSSAAASVGLELGAIDADDAELESESKHISSFNLPSNSLAPASITLCKLPAKTRRVEVNIRLSHIFTLLNNDAAIDAIDVRVIQTGLGKYVDGANLVPIPSAESPIAMCVWEGDDLAIRRAYAGATGPTQYQSSAIGNTNATTWVDISSAGATIDAAQRIALLNAYVGGDGVLEDSGEVTVTFYDINKHVLGREPSMTTGTVTPAERGDATKLLQREATLMVPHGARWAKVTMLFANTALTEGAAVDNVNLRLLHKLPTIAPSGPTEAPLESIYVRQLIKNGEAMYLPKTGWESESLYTSLKVIRSKQNLPGMSGRFFFRGPKGSEGEKASSYTSMYQEIDVSEAAADIDNGLVALGFSARAGAAAVGGASVSISLVFKSSAGTYLGSPFWKTVDEDARDKEAKLISVEYKACAAPSSTRIVAVTVRFSHWGTLLNNDAAADALSLRIVRKEPVPFVLGANLLPMASAESPAATCLWGGNNLTTTATYPGGDGTLQYSSTAISTSTVTLWVDLSADSAGIAAGGRHAMMTAHVGGSGPEQDSGELAITICDEDKKPIGTAPTMTTGVVSPVDRNNLPHLLERDADAAVPADARWAKVEMIFHNAATSSFAALDSLDFRILPAPPTLAPHTGPPLGDIFERELVHNGDANYQPNVGWMNNWGPLKVLRSDAELKGKTGKYFFRGAMGTSSKIGSAMTSAVQAIDISEAATEIDLGQVAAGFRGALGSLHADSASVTAFVSYYNAEDAILTVSPSSTKTRPSDRFGQAMLLPRYMQQCTVPINARKAEVFIMLQHFGTKKDNDAAFDDVSLRLYKKEPVVFAEDANLAPFPHAEATFAPCAWEGDQLTLRRSAPGADGALEYTAELGGETKATVWVDMSASAVSIDKSLRHATLGAHIGGSGSDDDSGEVTVAFFDAGKKPLVGGSVLTTGTVTAADRGNKMKLLERSAEMLVPVGARWAQLAMLFHNLNETLSVAAIDDIDFRVLPVGQTPSPATALPEPTPTPDGPTTAPGVVPTGAPDASGTHTAAPAGVPTAAPATPAPAGAPTRAPAGQGGAAGSGDAGPARPLSAGFRAGAQAVGGIAFAGSAGAGPVAAAQLGRAVAVVAAAAGCGRGSAAGDVAPLWPLSPFQMKVGTSTPGAYFRGAVVGNLIVVALVALLLVGIVAALKVVKFSTSTQPWHAAMAAVCFPSCLLVPAGLLAPGLMYGAIGAVTASGVGGDYLCAVLAFAIVCGAIGATAYFALTASRGTLDAMEFMLDRAQAGGVAWLLSDAGSWVSTTNQVGAQQQATLHMATMLYRPYRGVLFLWWVPVDLAITAAVGGAAGAAGTGCKGVSIVLALFLGIQAIAVLALRPHACRMRNTLVGLAGAVAAVAAAIFAVAAHRNDADPARLAHDGLIGLVAVCAIIAVLLYLVDAVLSTVKLIVECRKREAGADNNLELLFGGNLGQELVSEGMQESMAGAEDQEAGPMLAATTTAKVAAQKPAPPPVMESEDDEAIASVPAGNDDEEL